jgi:two-component system NtrC family sensor kinase
VVHPYVLLVSLSCLVCATCAGCVFATQPERRPNQLAGLLLLGIAFWAMCEVAWNLAADHDSALFLVQLATIGWVYIGPLSLHLAISSFAPEARGLRRVLPVLYGLSTVVLVLAHTSPLITSDVVATSWGWGYTVGPLFLPAYATIVAAIFAALHLVARDFRNHRSPAERRQGPWIVIGIAFPLCLSATTDVVLPVLGIQVPRLGTTSFAIMGLVAVGTLLRFGYSFLTPGTFAHEILAELPEGVALVRQDERISSVNPSLARLAGYSIEEMSGMAVSRILTVGSEEPSSEDSGAVLIRAASEDFECELMCASGDPIPVSVSSSVLRDRQNFPIGIVVVVRDQRLVADLRSRLMTSARLAAVGELAAGIAHEINNPISFVRTNLSLLQGHWKTIGAEFERISDAREFTELFREGDEMLEESLEGVNRAAEIVRGVQGFSHTGSGKREQADLNILLEDVLRMASTQLRGNATLERVYDELPPVHCAPQELKQVFLNLIVNAAHAIAEHGTIRVCTEAFGQTVEVCIEDDGCGIEPDIVDRVFDPFFTTKRVGDGTGLGLGIAYQIVRRHGGEISVSSKAGAGTRFRVVLPIGDAAHISTDREPSA